MKQIITLILAGLLVLGGALPVLGAMGPSNYYITDHWFTIEVQKPYIGARLVERDSETVEYFQYYQNEQTFFRLGYSEGNKLLVGSYLWESGWFFGAGFSDSVSGPDSWAISPGYRFNLDNGGFIAMSVDYIKYDNSGQTETGFEFDSVVRPENAKIETDIIYDRLTGVVVRAGRIDMSAMQVISSVDYQVSEHLVIGGSVGYVRQNIDDMSLSASNMSAGFTWDTNFAVVNVAVSDGNRSTRFDEAEILFKLSDDLRLDMEASKYSGESTSMYYGLVYYAGAHRFMIGYAEESGTLQCVYNMDI